MDQQDIEYQIDSIHGCLLAHEIPLQLVLGRSEALEALQDIDLQRLEAKLSRSFNCPTPRSGRDRQLRRFQSLGG